MATSIYLIAALVFASIFLGVVVSIVYLRRSPDRLARRLQQTRTGRSSHADQRAGGGDERASMAERLFTVDPESYHSLRAKLHHAGLRHRHARVWFYGTRFVLGGMIGFCGLQVQNLLEFTGAAAVLLVGFFAVMGFMLPMLWVNDRVRRRRQAIRSAVPNVLDLIIVCVEAGLGLNAAIQRIGTEMKSTYPELATELNILNQEIFIGVNRADAFRNLARRTGVDELRSLATVLTQSDRMGTGIADVLRVQADTLRTRRRQMALEAAHKMPVKLVFPLVLFIFPEILVVLLGPGGIQLFRTLTEVAR